MIFYGDEVGYTNDYSYLNDEGKSYDNRWMHRPLIDWKKNEKAFATATIEHKIYSGTQKWLAIRKALPVLADTNNLTWFTPQNIHVAGFLRRNDDQVVCCLFNFSNHQAFLTWHAIKEKGVHSGRLYDHWTGRDYTVGEDFEYLVLEPYGFHILEVG